MFAFSFVTPHCVGRVLTARFGAIPEGDYREGAQAPWVCNGVADGAGWDCNCYAAAVQAGWVF